jgi:chromosome partitioning protein
MSELLEHHVYVGGDYHTSDLIQATEYEHIDIIPANGYLMKTDMNLLMKQDENQVTRLKDALTEVSGAYDYCICDCGRLFDMVVINILLAAELVIAPVKVGGFENEALNNLAEQVTELQEINPDLRIKAIMTMKQKNKTSLEFEEWLKTSSGFDMFRTAIRRSIVVEKASIAMAAVPKFAKTGIVSQDYRDIAQELLEIMEG